MLTASSNVTTIKMYGHETEAQACFDVLETKDWQDAGDAILPMFDGMEIMGVRIVRASFLVSLSNFSFELRSMITNRTCSEMIPINRGELLDHREKSFEMLLTELRSRMQNSFEQAIGENFSGLLVWDERRIDVSLW